MSDKLYFDTSEANNLDALSAESDPSIAKPYNVKENYMYKDAFTKSIQIGTMPINTSVQVKIDPQTNNSNNWFYVIPEGYHDGTSKIYTGELSEYTPGNATPEDVLNNKVFWVDGERRVGTLSPERYEQSGTATADDLLYDKTAWVNGEQITGTIPILPRRDQTLLAGESYTFPYGLSPGTTVISAASLEIQTPGTATAEGILKGLTAWVNGEEITGTVDVDEMIETALGDTNTTQDDVLYGKTFYSSVYGQTVEGRMPDHTGEATKELQPGEMYAIPKGYYDGNSYITTKSLETSTEGTATADDLLYDKTAWVNGEQITGTIPILPRRDQTLLAGESYTFPYGLSPGTTVISAASLEIQTPGTATAEGILKGLTAWVNGEEITGTVDVDEMIETALGDTNTTQDDVLYGKTFYSSVYGQTVEGRMPDHTGEATKELQPGEMYAIPKGYYDGNSYITTKSLETSTEGTATAEDIVDQKTAWVNGEQITGTMPVNNIIQIRISAGKDITIPAGYYPNGVIIFALYTDNILDLTGTEAYYKDEGLYPNGTGYVDDTTFIVTAESITVET